MYDPHIQTGEAARNHATERLHAKFAKVKPRKTRGGLNFLNSQAESTDAKLFEDVMDSRKELTEEQSDEITSILYGILISKDFGRLKTMEIPMIPYEVRGLDPLGGRQLQMPIGYVRAFPVNPLTLISRARVPGTGSQKLLDELVEKLRALDQAPEVPPVSDSKKARIEAILVGLRISDGKPEIAALVMRTIAKVREPGKESTELLFVVQTLEDLIKSLDNATSVCANLIRLQDLAVSPRSKPRI